MDERATLIERILRLDHRVIAALQSGQTSTWLSVDLTMTQLKVLFIVYSGSDGTATAGQIARELGVSLSTVTGIVDRLCEPGFVTRGEDPRDRRVTRVSITPAGRELIERLHRAHLARMAPLLERLDTETLVMLERALAALYDAALEIAEERRSGTVAKERTSAPPLPSAAQ